MVRYGNLIAEIADIKNIELAFYKAKKGKTAKNEVIEYGKELNMNLKNLKQEIILGEVEVGDYNYFKIYDPKERLICAAPFSQRVLHHSIMNICHPIFEKIQIFDSYASRIDKGTYAAIERAKKFNKKYKWFLKLDFCKYFDSIDHNVLKIQLNRVFKDKTLLKIFYKIIDSYTFSDGKGVPIGNLTSQYFANHYLAVLDHYIKEEVRIDAYVRYMDDIVLWHDSKEYLIEAGNKLLEYAFEILKLELKPFCLNKSINGIPFLGYLLYGSRVLLAKRSRKRFSEKIKNYQEKLDNGEWSQSQFREHVTPLIGFTEHAEARGFRKNILKNNIE